MPVPSRRDFLASTSRAVLGSVAGSFVGVRRLDARPVATVALPRDVYTSDATADLLLHTLNPERLAPSDLRALATRAVGAARDAGAAYADIRLSERHNLWIQYFGADPLTMLGAEFTYGVRVMIDGAWAFVHGTAPTVDAVVTSVQQAVATARGYGTLETRRIDLCPAPVATGEWVMPIQLDPFTIPLRDQISLMDAFAGAVSRVLRTGTGTIAFNWTRETRIFGSTEGSLTTQTLWRFDPEFGIGSDAGMRPVKLHLLQPNWPCAGGYEAVAGPHLQEEIKAVAEEAARLAAIPRRAIEVGRYPIVFDGVMTGRLFGRTLGGALELDRALGLDADASGTSQFAPPGQLLGTQVTNRLLTVTGDRAMPTLPAVKWDDEGVEAHSFQLLKDGHLVDYCSSRQTAALLGDVYARRGMPVRSHGCAGAPNVENPILVRAPHLTVAAGTKSTTLNDLIKDMSHGLLVRDRGWMMTDQQLASGMITFAEWNTDGLLLEVVRGRIVRRVNKNALQFNTKRLWKTLAALGDANTSQTSNFNLYKGQPWHSAPMSATAPAALFTEIDVISTSPDLFKGL
jgi:TldD protein